jgi:hypothetical protein
MTVALMRFGGLLQFRDSRFDILYLHSAQGGLQNDVSSAYTAGRGRLPVRHDWQQRTGRGVRGMR